MNSGRTLPRVSQCESKAPEAKPAETKAAPKPVEAKPATQVASKPRKMDMKTAMLYSKALEAEDAGIN